MTRVLHWRVLDVKIYTENKEFTMWMELRGALLLLALYIYRKKVKTQ